VAPQAAGRVYNIGGGMRRSINDALAKIEEFAGHPLDLRRLATEKGDVRDTAADTGRARDELLWEPQAAWEESIRAQFDWVASEMSAAGSASG
jgi:nucleoside-diphosphate-sugar epimerase